MKKSELLNQLKFLYADLLCSKSALISFKTFYDISFINSSVEHLDFALDRFDKLFYVLEDKINGKI